MPGPVNCFTYCLLVYNPPPSPHSHTPKLLQAGPLLASLRAIDPKKQLRHFLSDSFPRGLPWQGGRDPDRGREGGLKGRWQGHSSEPGTAAGGRASLHCSYQPSPPQTLAGLSFAKHYCTYSTEEAVEFGHRRRICIPSAPPTGSTLRAPRIWMPPRHLETPPNS